MRIAVVTNIIAPYTNRLYDEYAAQSGVDLHVLACADLQPDRKWTVPKATHYELTALRGLQLHSSETSHLYFNPSVVPALHRLQPDIVLIAGHFSPTMMFAVGYARATGRPYGISTDGSLATDPGEYSRPHAWVRRLLIPRASFGIGASKASVELLARWGLPPERCTVVPIVNTWDAPPTLTDFSNRPFDVISSGSVNEARKGVLFLVEVLRACKDAGVDLSLRILGDGPDRAAMLEGLHNAGIKSQFDGYLQQHQLAAAYGSAKLLAFPSRGDAWGLVANEAVVCGTPVLASPHAVSSHELVAAFGVGLVRPLEVFAWRDAIIEMLSSEQHWRGFMSRRTEALASFGLAQSVSALQHAIERGLAKPASG